jgi:hypothetical protein
MNNTTTRATFGNGKGQVPAEPIKIKYCLYARKSTESEERQILSIDSQVKEMLQLAEREGLDVVEIKRESHSAKDTGQRPIFNEIIEEIRQGPKISLHPYLSLKYYKMQINLNPLGQYQ